MADKDAGGERRKSQRRVAESLGVPVIRRHILLCCDQTKPQCSEKERSLVAWDYLKRRLKELGLAGSGGIYRTKIIQEHLLKGRVVAEHLIVTRALDPGASSPTD